MWKNAVKNIVKVLISVVLILALISALFGTIIYQQTVFTSIDVNLTSMDISLSRTSISLVVTGVVLREISHKTVDQTVYSNLAKAEVLLEIAQEYQNRAEQMAENLPDTKHFLSTENLPNIIKSPVYLYMVHKINDQTNFFVDLARQYITEAEEKLK